MKEQQNILIQTQKQNQKQLQNKIRGILWGAVLGDVIGAFLQFNRGIDQSKISQAFLIKGGGMHKLQPGQPTDDSQLSYALGKGLVRGKGQLNLNMIAEEMGNWFLSKPIDVGGTIRCSVPKACNMKVHQAHLVRKGAKQNSQGSQSNGTLMAISPLVIWCHRLSPADIIKAVRQYTILIHPNQTVVLANTFYVLMGTYLLNTNNTQNQQKIRQNSYKQAKQQISLSPSFTKQSDQKKQFLNWLNFIQDAVKDPKILQKYLPAVKKSGWIRIAFTYGIYQLLTNKSYKLSIANILRLKGDTDTNACIAGTLLGSYYGYNKIQSQLNKQIQITNNWRPKNIKRPDWLVPGLVIQKFIKNLIMYSPKQLKIVGAEQQYK